MRVFAEALRKALRAQVLRDPDLEIATIDTTQQVAGAQQPLFEHVKLGDGVMVTPTPVTAGEEIQLWYGGLLAKSGAKDVFLHCGIGPGAWQDVRDIRMTQEASGIFSCTLQAAENGGRFEFCFKDSSGNWDNNSGRNWSFAIHNGLIH